MTHLLYRHTDSNMGGYSWEWVFFVSSDQDRTWSLSGKMTLLGFGDGDEPEVLLVHPVQGIQDGIDLYDRFRSILGTHETGIDPDSVDLEQLTQNLEKVSLSLSEEFFQGLSTFEKREEENDERERERRRLLIEPFSSVIDDFLEQFSADRRKYTGSIRGAIRIYIENYLVDHGELPTGLHDVSTVGGTVLFEP